jgi:hypothetical protein
LTAIVEMILCASVTSTKSTEPAKTTLRGSVLDVVRDLLADGRRDELLEVVGKLVARNAELEVLLGKVAKETGASASRATSSICSSPSCLPRWGASSLRLTRT